MDERDDPPREGAEDSSSCPRRRLSLDAARERLRERGYLDRGVEGAVLKGALAARTPDAGVPPRRGDGRRCSSPRPSPSRRRVLARRVVGAAAPRRGGALPLALRGRGGRRLARRPRARLPRARSGPALRGDAEEGSTEIAVAFGVLAGVAGVLAARPALESAGLPGGRRGPRRRRVRGAHRRARGAGPRVHGPRGLRAALRDATARARSLAWAVAGGTLVLVGRLRALLPRSGGRGRSSRRGGERAPRRRGRRGRLDGGPSGRRGGARVATSKEARDPAAFWTTVATGESVKRHGIGSLDLVRVAGVGAPVRPLAGAGWYLEGRPPGSAPRAARVRHGRRAARARRSGRSRAAAGFRRSR